MRIALFGFISLVLLAAGCTKQDGNGNGNPMAPGGPPSAGSTIEYSAVGASDAIGFGSSQPCLIPFEDCNGNGYVWVAARQLRTQGFTVNVANRGIATATVSRAFQDLGNQNGHQIFGNLIQQSAPFIRVNATLVTVFSGVNDVNAITAALGNGAGGTNPAAFVDEKVNAFATDFAELISIIRGRSGSAQIVILNLPNVGAIPALATRPVAQKQAAQRAAVGITQRINATPNAAIVDVMCDSRFYQASNFASDGLHPNDAGYAILGAEIVRAATSPGSYPAPRSSCSQMTLF